MNIPYGMAEIKKACIKNQIVWKNHAAEKMTERSILRKEVIECIMNGDIIEVYPNDKPFISCLVFGYTIDNKPLHVVCSYSDDYLYIITVYEPNKNKLVWENDLKTRR